MQSSPGVWKIFHEVESSGLEDRQVPYRHPFCDIFTMRSQGRGEGERLVLSEKAGRSAWPEEWYHNHQIKHLSWRHFGDFSLPCPANPELYLARSVSVVLLEYRPSFNLILILQSSISNCRMYGSDWFTVGATADRNHHNRDIVTPSYFNLQEIHYSPAKPFR